LQKNDVDSLKTCTQLETTDRKDKQKKGTLAREQTNKRATKEQKKTDDARGTGATKMKNAQKLHSTRHHRRRSLVRSLARCA